MWSVIDIVIAPVDGIMATDNTAPLSIKAFLSMECSRVLQSFKCSFHNDHAAPALNERIANLHQMMRDFASEQGFPLYDIGEGVCHQVIMEKRNIKPGDIFMGADSYTPHWWGHLMHLPVVW